MTILVLWSFVSILKAADWPAFQGPNGNNTSADVPAKWSEPKLKWKIDLAGKSYGGIAVKDKYVIVTDHAADGSEDLFWCVNAASGKELWKVVIENGKEMDFGASPRAHPLIHEEMVYFMNAWGQVQAVNLKDGKKVWEIDLVEDYGGQVPDWGYSTSPIIAEGHLILMPGKDEGLIAINPKTAEDVWAATCHVPNYAGLLVAEFGGVKQVIGYDMKTLRGWSMKDGKEIWQLEISSPNDYIVPAPTKLGDKLLLTDDFHGARVYGFEAGGKVVDKILVEQDELNSELATPLVVDDFVYFSVWGLICADGKTLKPLWPAEDVDVDKEPFLNKPFDSEMAAFITNGKQLLIFLQSGDLVLLPVSKEKPQILGSAKLCEETQVLPALSGNYFYVRDENHLYCYQISGF